MTAASRLTILALLVLLPQASRADDDAHDKLVYSRYSRSFQPIDYKAGHDRAHLDQLAAKGARAIFSFEGLGEARVAELPKNDRPWHPGIHPPLHWDRIRVLQAEELNVDGKWKLYYGVVSDGTVAVVPAEEWEIWWPDAPWMPCQTNPFPDPLVIDPFSAPDAENWAITIQPPGPETWTRKAGDPLTVTVHFRNNTHREKALPLTWVRDGKNGGPAMHAAVSLTLEWAPFHPYFPFPKFDPSLLHSRKEAELEPIHTTQLEQDGTTRSVKPGESCELFNFDLHDWFEIENEGYYIVRIRIDRESLGLHGEPEVECKRVFTIGEPPRFPAIEEYNKSLPILSGPAGEDELKRLIKDTVKPEPVERKPLSPELERLLAWSDPVGGLVARIEGGTSVRLKNVSEEPLIVPTGNPSDEKATPLFDLYVQQGTHPWRRIAGEYQPFVAAPADPEARLSDLPRVDPPWVTLRPGEDCIALFQASDDEEGTGEAKIVKIRLRQPDTSVPGRWSGVLETPARPWLSAEQSSALRATLPIPEHLPAFSYDVHSIVNYGGHDIEHLEATNSLLIHLLEYYEPASVCAEFEQRMREEKVLAMKLLLASIAAPAGSEEAALVLLEMLKDTDYHSVVNTQCALGMTCENYWGWVAGRQSKPPDWLMKLSLVAVSDQRFVTGFEKTDWARGTAFRVRTCNSAHYALGVLSRSKSREAVPVLIELVKDGYDAIGILGEIGDERAIPVLLKLLEETDPSKLRDKDGYLSRRFSVLTSALSDLNAKQAVPALLQFIENPEIYDDLAKLGDPAAAAALREIVATDGKLIRSGEALSPELDKKRLFTAKMALCMWDADGGVARLYEMLSDKATTRSQRYDIVMKLSNCRDPKTIPALLKTVKTDHDHYIINMAIWGLSELKCEAAVEGLIGCFDVEFKEENVFKEHVTPATYRNQIARSLQRLTGQPFGADKQQWLKWWQEEGQHSIDLK